MDVTASRVTFLLFPRDDAGFTALVESLTGENGMPADQLEPHLRATYPLAVVRHRDPLGEIDQTAETWYVYRDGAVGTTA